MNNHLINNQVIINDPINIDDNDNYFCSINYNDDEFNINDSRCLLYNNIETIDKLTYLTLSLEKDFALFIQNLYTNLKTQLYENSVKWFEEPLTLNEIENNFIFPLKINIEKGTYELRTIVNMNNFFVKDNNNNEVNIENIKGYIIPNIQIKGISFNSKNFNLDVVLNNIIVQNNENISEIEEYDVKKDMINNDEEFYINDNKYFEVCEFIDDNIQNIIINNINNILNKKKINVDIDIAKEIFENEDEEDDEEEEDDEDDEDEVECEDDVEDDEEHNIIKNVNDDGE